MDKPSMGSQTMKYYLTKKGLNYVCTYNMDDSQNDYPK